MRRLFTNPAAAIVMVGVCILPSLYAWFNIAANMDPYGNTGNIKVAIANCDAGASTETMTLDAGGTIVDTLKENKQLGWTFVSEKQAKAGVTSGKYYAAIVIPEDFSESLLSILDGEVKQPELDYYINEKKMRLLRRSLLPVLRPFSSRSTILSLLLPRKRSLN